MAPRLAGAPIPRAARSARSRPGCGLHGIDANPKLHPFARLDTLGKSCTQNAECGEEGNRCTKVGTRRLCSATCLADSACPTGYRCKSVAATGTTTVVGKQCLK